MNEVDFFICHANEDKQRFVRPLAEALKQYGARVWYDEFSLSIGDSLTRSIDRGLANARYGVVVLSSAFLAKKWTEYELRGLNLREISGTKTILPIWLELDQAQVMAFSPSLADKLAIISAGDDIERVALRLLELARPELFRAVEARKTLLELISSGKQRRVPTSSLKIAPRRHAELPGTMLNRIRLVRAVLFEVHPHSMEHWVDALARDVDPEIELRFWEHISATFLEYAQCQRIRKTDRKHVFTLILAIGAGLSAPSVERALKHLPDNAVVVIREIYTSPRPPYDIEDKLIDQ